MTLSSKRLLQIFAVLSAWALIVIARLVQVLVEGDEVRDYDDCTDDSGGDGD